MELLIKAVNGTGTHGARAAANNYERGDVIVVKPDGHQWGASERLPSFWIVKVPGMSVSDDTVKSLLAPRMLPEFGDKKTKNRDHQFNTLALSVGAQNALASTGIVVITEAAFRSAARKKA